MAQRFDAASAKITGDAVVAADPVDFYVAQSQARFSVSSTGVLVYSPGGAAAHAQLTWFDRSGKPLGTLGPPGDVFWPAISPDGKTVAVYRTDAQNVYDVWLHDSTRDSAYRLTAHPKGTSMFPLWSPDGAYVSYFSDWQPPGKLYRKAASGAGGEEVLLAPEPPMRADDWSRDGRYLVGETGRAVASGNLWVLPLSGDGKPRQLLHSEFRETQARISPDSRWVAYATDRTTRNEVYVTSFPTAGAQTQISTAGGRFPVWSADGKELFYLAPDGSLMAVPVKPGSAFEAGVAKRLFGVHLAGFASNTSRFDVSKDGRFLIPVELGGSEPQSMIAVVNWTAGLKQ
jgi:Tol biopolymer transport system component